MAVARGEMRSQTQKRANLRPQMLSGKSRHSGEPLQEGLRKKNWPDLLDVHYECEVPGPSVCLQDALHMITTGKVLITCPGAKKRKKDERQEEKGDEEPHSVQITCPET